MEAGDGEEINEEIILIREQRQKLLRRIDSQMRVRDESLNNLLVKLPELASDLELSMHFLNSSRGRGRVSGRKRATSETGTIPRENNKRVAENGMVINGSSRGTLGIGSLTNDASNGNRVLGRGLLKSNDGELENSFCRNGKVGNCFGRNEETENRFDWRGENWTRDRNGESYNSRQQKDGDTVEALAFVKVMVAACLLAPTTSLPQDSGGLYRKLLKEPSRAERDALADLGGREGGVKAVEKALKSLVEATRGGLEVEEYELRTEIRLMVLSMDRSKILREIPSPRRVADQGVAPTHPMGMAMELRGGGLEPNGGPVSHNLGPPGHYSIPNMWGNGNDPHLLGPLPGSGPHIFPGPGGLPSAMVHRGGPRGPPGMMGMPGPPGMFGGMPGHFQRSLVVQQGMGAGPPEGVAGKSKGGNDGDLKELEAILNKKSFRELEQSKAGEELLELLHKPTARETAVAAKFKTKGGSALKEYCVALTKVLCNLQRRSFMPCEKMHFQRIIAPHTDVNLGDCSFLDTCRHMKTCKYVHYELEPTEDLGDMMSGIPGHPKSLKPKPKRRAEYCSDAELGEAQWINCDIRTFKMDVLGQFGVIMADPPWDIHMELPYGTMEDQEMCDLSVPALQTDGLIFLWVTGRAMELGRECLDLWGYRRIEEIIWVKTNQLQRIIRTGRTGHWLNHSKEHCLVGIKGNPDINQNIDTDVIVGEVRETSRKPDEMYSLLERISPGTRKLELFARMHNTHAGWISIGNQVAGVHLVDEGLRARYKKAYPDIKLDPISPSAKANGQDGVPSTPIKNPLPGAVAKENGVGGRG